MDEKDNLISVGSVDSDRVILPYGLKGLIGVGFSGLSIKFIKFNKDLVRFEKTALSNCKDLTEITLYNNQLSLIQDLHSMYPNLIIVIHKENV